ncbi:MAG: ferrous iron transporter B, partial [Ignavibacteria bacterium]|nr:ferrous iron transporter B [Ignavibacteria bacterium]
WLAAPLMEGVDHLFSHLSDYVISTLGQGWLSDLLSNGIIGGLGAVFVFLPQIVILFIILGFLEDSGYLARGAMLIDLPLSKIGLNGRSFVPMLSGFACAIPAVMAARTIQNKRERYLTIFIIPLMSCSARLPVYGLLLAFLLPGRFILSGFVLSLIYLLGVITSLIVAGVLNKYKNSILKIEDNSSFIMELPVYRIPRFSNIFKHTYENAWEYVRKAGPIIIVFSIILWFLTYFPEPESHSFQNSTHRDSVSVQNSEIVNTQNSLYDINPDYDRIANSYAARIGRFIEPVMIPLGLDWRVGVSLITTFAAREVFVSSLALIFKIPETGDENIRESLLKSMKDAKIHSTGEQLFTTSTIIGLIFFFVLAMQCISTLAITKKETGGWKLPIIQVTVYTGSAYVAMFIVVNSLRFFGIS